MKNTGIETRTRNVKQGYRMFTDEQRRDIIQQIDNRPAGVPIEEMFLKFGFGRSGSTYYIWRKKFGMRTMGRKVMNSMNVSMFSSMNVKSVKKSHTVTLSVEVGSLMELIGFCNNIVKTPKVKSILSVE